MRISYWSSDVCSSDLVTIYPIPRLLNRVAIFDAIHRDGHGGSCLKPSSWKGAPSPFGSSAHPANDVQEADKAAFLYSCKHRCRSGSQRCKYSHMRQLRPANIDLESRIAVADDIDCPRKPAILPKSKPDIDRKSKR